MDAASISSGGPTPPYTYTPVSAPPALAPTAIVRRGNALHARGAAEWPSHRPRPYLQLAPISIDWTASGLTPGTTFSWKYTLVDTLGNEITNVVCPDCTGSKLVSTTAKPNSPLGTMESFGNVQTPCGVPMDDYTSVWPMGPSAWLHGNALCIPTTNNPRPAFPRS
jgi:hypothetical protein